MPSSVFFLAKGLPHMAKSISSRPAKSTTNSRSHADSGLANAENVDAIPMAHSANPSALTKTHLAHTAQSSARHTKQSAWGKKPSAQGSNPSAVAQSVQPAAQSASTCSASEQPKPANSTRPKRVSYKLDVKSPCRFVPQELYQRMSDDLHLTGKAERTRQGYLRAV